MPVSPKQGMTKRGTAITPSMVSEISCPVVQTAKPVRKVTKVLYLRRASPVCVTRTQVEVRARETGCALVTGSPAIRLARELGKNGAGRGSIWLYAAENAWDQEFDVSRD